MEFGSVVGTNSNKISLPLQFPSGGTFASQRPDQIPAAGRIPCAAPQMLIRSCLPGSERLGFAASEFTRLLELMLGFLDSKAIEYLYLEMRFNECAFVSVLLAYKL